VFFLEGGRPTFGPRAAELTGQFYKNLADRNYFAPKSQEAQTVPIASAQPDEQPILAAQPGPQQLPK